MRLPSFRDGVIGFDGFNGGDIVCAIANGDNNFIKNGIVEGSLILIDKALPFRRGKLNIFRTDGENGESVGFRISTTKLEKFPYYGRIIMSVNQQS